MTKQTKAAPVAGNPRRRPSRVPTSPPPSESGVGSVGAIAEPTTFALTIASLTHAAEAVALAVINHDADRRRRGFPVYSGRWCDAEINDIIFNGVSHRIRPVDGGIVCAGEKRLAERGWLLLPVPRLVKRAGKARHCSPLEWDASLRWCAVPPESSAAAARTFEKKGDAMAWAEGMA